jgi:ribosome-associated protein
VAKLQIVSSQDSKALLRAVIDRLSEKKAENIVAINMAGKSEIADYMIVASGTSSRHVASLAQNAEEVFKDFGKNIISITGQEEGSWVLLDSPEIIVHLFQPDARDTYQIEKLWEDAPVRKSPITTRQFETAEMA